MNSSFKPFLLVATIVFMAWLADQAEAQTPWQGFSGKSSVAMNYKRLHFKSNDYWRASGTLLALEIATRGTDRRALIIKVPFAFYRESYKSYHSLVERRYSQGLPGNPYFGARILSPNPFVSFDFGLRLPITGDSEIDAAVSGMLADIDQMEAFIHNYLLINLGFSFDMKNSEGVFARLTAAPNYWIYIGKSKYVDFAELILHYGAIVGFENQDIRLQGGISGLTIFSEGDAFTDETSMHQFGLEMSYRVGKFWPGIHFRLPLDDDTKDVIDFVWGISVMYEGE